MRLTKEGQEVWDKMKAEGMTNEEIFEAVPVFPHEYESEEEEIEQRRLVREFIIAENAKRTPEQQKKLDEFVERLKKEDEENEKE